MMKKLELREMVLCALFIALITVGTFIRIPVDFQKNQPMPRM